MLNVPAKFPHVGSTAYLRGTGGPARILRRNADGTCLVELLESTPTGPARSRTREASGNRQVEGGDLYETQQLAVFCGRPPKRARARTMR